VEKETRHIFISLFLVQGRGGMGLFHSYKLLYISHKLHEAKKPEKLGKHENCTVKTEKLCRYPEKVVGV
jgi:hypothetical protein